MRYLMRNINERTLANLRDKARTTHNEAGQTAILTTIFFTILMTIITVGMMNIVSAAQSQNRNMELQSAARAAAESGIQDAERVLAYCASGVISSAHQAMCKSIFTPDTTQTCSTIMNQFSATSTSDPLYTSGLDPATHQVKVGVTGSYSEYYSCLKISAANGDYVRDLPGDGSSIVVPLTSTTNISGVKVTPTYVVVQWHDTSVDGDVGSLLGGSDMPTRSSYNSSKRPAVLRVQLAKLPNTFDMDNTAQYSRAVTLRPSTSDGSTSSLTTSSLSGKGALASTFGSSSKAYSFESWKQSSSPNSAANVPLFQRSCSSTIASYKCFMVFNGLGSQNFLRLQAYYRGTRIRVLAYDTNGNQLYFGGVQATVDSTGRAADSFQRINARLDSRSDDDGSNTNANNWFSDYAIDSGGSVCKELTVFDSSGTLSCP